MKMKYVKRIVRQLMSRTYMHLLCPFHKVQKKILFSSFGGRQYSDNPRAISEKMHELYPDYQIAWEFVESAVTDCVPAYVQIVRKGRMGFGFYRALATSCCYVTNGALHGDVIKRRRQYFVQTWHGDVGMKKVLYETWKDGKMPLRLMDKRYTDLCIAGSDYAEQAFRTAFRYNGPILKEGTPRNDRLIVRDPVAEAHTKKTLGVPPEVKVLLYAPTFRDSNRSGGQSVQVDLEKVLRSLTDKGESWVCIVRAHAAAARLNYASDGKGQIIDATTYPDMAELLAIADMLITDYSSCAGDMIRCDKPTILAHFDCAEYVKNDRELKYDAKEAGFFVAHDQQELLSIIRTKTEEDYRENCRKLREHFGIVETGHAAEAVCKAIHEHCSAFSL